MKHAQLITLADSLRARIPDIAAKQVVAGFDGFVDEMIQVVDQRQDLQSFRPVPDIATFGKLVSASAGLSSLREIVVNAMHAGGCSVNFGDGIQSLGAALSVFATLGNPVHSAFTEFLSGCAYHESWGQEPGRTLAFEFADGKLMFSAVAQLQEVTPELVAQAIGQGAFVEKCRQADLIAQTNWSLYPHMTAVWRYLQDHVYAGLENRPWVVVDLVDPSSREAAAIEDMLKVLPGFEKGTRCALGLNLNEAAILGRLLGQDLAPTAEPAVAADHAAFLRERIGVSQVFIHDRFYAAAADAEGQAWAYGPYTSRPVKSTGAGDRFNSGYALSLMLGFSLDEAVCVGGAASGFFVRNARSASATELADFLAAWGKGEVEVRVDLPQQ